MSARRYKGSWWCDFRFDGERYRRKSPINTKRGAEKHERELMRRLRAGLPIDDAPEPESSSQPANGSRPVVSSKAKRSTASVRPPPSSAPEPMAEVAPPGPSELPSPAPEPVVEVAPPARPSTPQVKRKEVPTFKAFAEEFMNTYAKANNKQSEQKAKRCNLDCHLLPAFGKMRLDQIGTREIEGFKAKLLTGKRSRKRINNVLATLSRILNYAAEVGELTAAPRIKMLKTEDGEVKFLDFPVYERLVTAAEADPLWHAALLLGGDAGLRLGEIRALRPEHWNRRGARITVQRSLWQDIETATKGWKRRTVPLTERLQKALEALGDGRTYMISDHRSAPLTMETTRWHLPKICGRAGIEPVGWHSLRHTFCSHLAMMGVPPRTIQELAGHADLKTTLKYMHLAEGETDRAIRILERRDEHIEATRQADDEHPASNRQAEAVPTSGQHSDAISTTKGKRSKSTRKRRANSHSKAPADARNGHQMEH